MRGIRKNKNSLRVRESTYSFVGEKYGLYEENYIKFIQNEMERRRVKIYE